MFINFICRFQNPLIWLSCVFGALFVMSAYAAEECKSAENWQIKAKPPTISHMLAQCDDNRVLCVIPPVVATNHCKIQNQCIEIQKETQKFFYDDKYDLTYYTKHNEQFKKVCATNYMR